MHFRNVNGYFVCILEKAIGSHGTMGTDSSELPCRYHKSSRTASSGLNHSSPATNFFLMRQYLPSRAYTGYTACTQQVSSLGLVDKLCSSSSWRTNQTIIASSMPSLTAGTLRVWLLSCKTF